MIVTSLDSKSTDLMIQAAISKHSIIEIATAWASDCETSKILVENRGKVSNAIIGVSRCYTDPNIIDRIADINNFYVAKTSRALFHPKAYLFRSENESELIIGSSNLTKGGLDKNTELCVHITGSSDEPIFSEVSKSIRGYLRHSEPATAAFAKSYRLQHASRVKDSTLDPVFPSEEKEFKRTKSKLVNLSWDDFRKKTRLDPHHNFEKRLEILREAQSIFMRSPSFSSMSQSERKAISGVIGENKQLEFSPNLDWAWFGTMRGAGDFAKLVGNNNKVLSEAVDSIPIRGTITKDDYIYYINTFINSFSESTRIGGVATATRILTMKRPDIFVAINGKNKYRIAIDLDFSPSTLDKNNYWERVIEPIQISDWYNSPRPRGKDGELWDFRAAMLDTIYYDE